MDAEVGGKKEEIRGSRKREVRQRSLYGILRMDVEEKDRMGKQKLVIINGEEKEGMRRNQKNHQRRSIKLVQRPLIYTWYLPSSLLPSSFFLLPSSFFLLPSSFFLLPSSFFLLFSINRGQYLRIGRPTALHRRQQWQLFRQKQMV